MIYKNAESEKQFTAAYGRLFQHGSVPYESKFVDTSYGATHIISCGHVDNPPLVLIHGITATSHMWIDNIKVLSDHYRVYWVETFGD